MRIPGYTPNYHNTAANRAVHWGTVNNPVSNCSILFQLSNVAIQWQSLKSSSRMFSRVFSYIVPRTTPSADLSFINSFNQARHDALSQPMSIELASLFIHRPDIANILVMPPVGPEEQAAPATPILPDPFPTPLRIHLGWDSVGGIFVNQFLASSEHFRSILLSSPKNKPNQNDD